MVKTDTWGFLWIAWALTSLGSFLVIELIAIFTHRMDRTLSDNLRRALGIYPIRPWRKLGGVLFASVPSALLAVLIWHILTP
jgi:hypothetical protein